MFSIWSVVWLYSDICSIFNIYQHDVFLHSAKCSILECERFPSFLLQEHLSHFLWIYRNTNKLSRHICTLSQSHWFQWIKLQANHLCIFSIRSFFLLHCYLLLPFSAVFLIRVTQVSQLWRDAVLTCNTANRRLNSYKNLRLQSKVNIILINCYNQVLDLFCLVECFPHSSHTIQYFAFTVNSSQVYLECIHMTCMECLVGLQLFLVLNKEIASTAVFVIVSGSDGQTETIWGPAK